MARVPGGENTSTVNDGTRTLIAEESLETKEPPVYTLRLQPKPRIHWDSNVVDNEGKGKKSSKCCCIFHKPRAFDESDSDESSSESSESDVDNSRARPSRKKKKKHKHSCHMHHCDNKHDHDHHSH